MRLERRKRGGDEVAVDGGDVLHGPFDVAGFVGEGWLVDDVDASAGVGIPTEDGDAVDDDVIQNFEVDGHAFANVVGGKRADGGEIDGGAVRNLDLQNVGRLRRFGSGGRCCRCGRLKH